MNKLSFIIPCYGSESSIAGVVNEILQTVASRNEYSYEIILVNDCSPDNVYQVIKELAERDTNIKGISLSKNFGQHSAIITGMNYVTGDIIICLDDDGQTPANELFNLVDKLNNGYDLVFGKYETKKHSWFRNVGTVFNDFMAEQLVGKPKGLSLTSYFATKRFVAEEVKKYKNPYPYIAGLLLRSTSRISDVHVRHRKREVGTSGYTLKKLISLWFNGFSAFSVKPLRIASVVGIFFALLGFAFGIFNIVNKLNNPQTPLGYASLISAIVFIGGVQMIVLGMIGEYIGRIYISINNSPQYVIVESINIEDVKNV